MNTIALVSGVFFAVAIVVLGWHLVRDPRRLLRSFLTVKQLGLFEGKIANLHRVVVVAHQIEDPSDSLRAAVQANIARGVKYLFLVSPSRLKQEREQGYSIFAALADMVIAREQKAFKAQEVVDIQALPYEWDDLPFIFYELREKDRPLMTRVVVFRGNQRREGIAEGYVKVERTYARTLHRSVILGTQKVEAQSERDEAIAYDADPSVLSLQAHIQRTHVRNFK